MIGKWNEKYQWCVLLIASYLFYSFAGIKAMLFLIFTTITTWYGAIKIEQVSEKQKELAKNKSVAEKKEIKKIATKKKKKILSLILILNIGILVIGLGCQKVTDL